MPTQIGYGKYDAISTPCDFYVPLTAFSIAPQTNLLLINPAGTLATGTVLFPTNPNEGQTLEIMSTQTQTAITLTAGTGDTISAINAATALTANTSIKYIYQLAGAVNSSGVVVNTRTWFRIK